MSEERMTAARQIVEKYLSEDAYAKMLRTLGPKPVNSVLHDLVLKALAYADAQSAGPQQDDASETVIPVSCESASLSTTLERQVNSIGAAGSAAPATKPLDLLQLDAWWHKQMPIDKYHISLMWDALVAAEAGQGRRSK